MNQFQALDLEERRKIIVNHPKIPARPLDISTPNVGTGHPDEHHEEFRRLQRAIWNGNFAACRNILMNSRNLSQIAQKWDTLLYYAARTNQVDICELLIQEGAPVDQPYGFDGSTPLNNACKYGHLPVVTLLLQKWANPMRTNNFGMNCLHMAAARGHALIITYLLAKNYPRDSESLEGKTPLIYASTTPGEDSARALLLFGATTTYKDVREGGTALHWAIKNKNKSVVKLLLKKGANILEENYDRETPLQMLLKEDSFWFQRDQEFLRLAISSSGARHGILYEKLRSYQKMNIYSWPIFLLPFILLVWLGQILHSDVTCWVKAILIFVYVVMINKSLQNVKEEEFNRIVPLSFYCSLNILMYWSWFYWIKSPVSSITSANFVFSSLVVWTGFFLSAVSDPGYCRVGDRVRNQQIVELSENGSLNERHWCSTCLVRRPVRSKHCTYCNKCIARHDHHCPWMRNCIGWKNHKYFMLFLIGDITTCIIYLAAVIHHLQIEIRAAQSLWHIVAENTYLNYVASWILIKTGVTLALLGLQVYQIVWLGMTTNERLNWSRYHQELYPHCSYNVSPYNEGILGNILNFLELDFDFCNSYYFVIHPRINWKYKYK